MTKSKWWKRIMIWLNSRIDVEFSIVTNGENKMAVVNKINVNRTESPRVKLGMKFVDHAGNVYIIGTRYYYLINIDTGEALDEIDYEDDWVATVEDNSDVTFLPVKTITIE